MEFYLAMVTFVIMLQKFCMVFVCCYVFNHATSVGKKLKSIS